MATASFTELKPGTIFFAENRRYLKLDPLAGFPSPGAAVGANAYCYNQRKYEHRTFDQVEIDESPSASTPTE